MLRNVRRVCPKKKAAARMRAASILPSERENRMRTVARLPLADVAAMQ
jgi:hypothetical protein